MSATKIVMRLVSISFTILFFVVVVYGLYELGIRSYDYGYRIFAEPPVASGEGKDRLVRIKSSMSDSDIAQLLEEKGLIRDKWLFIIQLKLSGYGGKLAAGQYTLNTSMTADEMMQTMSQEESEEAGEAEDTEDTKKTKQEDSQ
ncbi:MAG: endolytic transglycosylase MltG [Eubacterium sp.]|nr:endolytic transglycosylase MltG [Eubacterium sp.]